MTLNTRPCIGSKNIASSTMLADAADQPVVDHQRAEQRGLGLHI
jgi:hypothetical protein